MALDFQQVREQVIQMGEQAPNRAEHFRALREQARATLVENAHKNQYLREKVQAALTANANLRCALPLDEALNQAFGLPPLPEEISILAADGSQINPDRHASVDYCLVNVGAIQMRYGSPASPETTVRSRLFYDDLMYTSSGRVTERLVALRRDLRERQLLAELAQEPETPIITLTDGPLELWVGRESEPEAKEYEKHFKDYLKALRQLHKSGTSTAGYIDRPRGDLLIRLLEIAQLPINEIEKAGREYRPLRGITDADLFQEILKPGERSAIFGIQSRNAGKYAAELALHFFYLNVGHDDEHSYPVRVEIPAWVAEEAQMLNDLQAVLVHQCQVMGNRTYPYLLHRSHEVAVVTQDEKRQLENMISLEIQRRLGTLGDISQKQGSKDDSGQKGRYRK
jgi:hypothetical protein